MCLEIADDDWLLRAIPSQELDPVTGEITSFSFNSAHLSVSRYCIETVRLLLARQAYAYLAALSARYCREIGLTIETDPTPEDPEHCVIVMMSGRSSRATKLKRHATLVSTAGGDADAVFYQLTYQLGITPPGQ